MNRILQYKVARLPFRVIFQDETNSESLLPSFAPFQTELTDEQLCFTLVVNDSSLPKERGKEIGQFDSGGNNHGVYRTEKGEYRILISDIYKRQCCLLMTNNDLSYAEVALRGDSVMRSLGLNNALMIMFAFSNAQNGTLLMHSSVIRYEGKGYLFLGVSGTGKSTHTANWLKWVKDCDLMNDDNPIVRFIDGKALVFGSPWSGKTPCYRNIEAPVGAFVQLEQAPHNNIRPMKVVETFATLLPSCSVMKWDDKVYTGICETVGNIMETTTTYLLDNLPDRAAVELSYKTLTGKQLS